MGTIKDPVRNTASRRSGARGRRGNAFVELAFVLVPLLAMIFGIIDFGFAIFIRSTFQHAVREGVRYAVTFQVMPGMQHDASIKQVVKNNAMGFLSDALGDSRIFIRYYDPTTLAFTAANAPGNVVEISIEGFNWGWMAPLLRSGTPMLIQTRSSDRMESLPAGVAPPAR
jgi:hypothetical protein